MDGPVSGSRRARASVAPCPPHARRHDARRAAFGSDGVTEMTAPIGAVSKDLAGIGRQHIRTGLTTIDIGGRDGDLLHQVSLGIAPTWALKP